MEKDFTGIDYLAQGTPRQRHCHRVLSSLRLFERLEAYGPVLAGTFPIGIDVPGSDLDIVCQVEDFEAFRRLLERHFGSREAFEVAFRADEGVLLCRFLADDLPVEVYASSQDPHCGNAFRHMQVEARLLALFGPEFRRTVVCRKERGMKTEPAFADVLDLPGDPYRAVLELAGWTDADLLGLYPPNPGR